MFNLQDPFYRPLWLRIAIVAVSLGWALMEVLSGSPGFALLFGAIGLYAAHQFFIAWTDPDDGA
ncbi:hypothetical protein [Pseudoprimorskyibacter insulae]|uniref:DUF3329 domain-containing protein n=1 Tax=Pseudoprimorskyibacter insulae TaxID=1695997 RepID=A0A2R8B0Y8_9RHOB|nr:hypothetical protein [Pseudoprimorskyibacter insulae]SPF81958.1 hypothetical protein PRI8871_03786 [Pseudoprimorskyibacter insulae]